MVRAPAFQASLKTAVPIGAQSFCVFEVQPFATNAELCLHNIGRGKSRFYPLCWIRAQGGFLMLSWAILRVLRLLLIEHQFLLTVSAIRGIILLTERLVQSTEEEEQS